MRVLLHSDCDMSVKGRSSLSLRRSSRDADSFSLGSAASLPVTSGSTLPSIRSLRTRFFHPGSSSKTSTAMRIASGPKVIRESASEATLPPSPTKPVFSLVPPPSQSVSPPSTPPPTFTALTSSASLGSMSAYVFDSSLTPPALHTRGLSEPMFQVQSGSPGSRMIRSHSNSLHAPSRVLTQHQPSISPTPSSPLPQGPAPPPMRQSSMPHQQARAVSPASAVMPVASPIHSVFASTPDINPDDLAFRRHSITPSPTRSRVSSGASPDRQRISNPPPDEVEVPDKTSQEPVEGEEASNESSPNAVAAAHFAAIPHPNTPTPTLPLSGSQLLPPLASEGDAGIGGGGGGHTREQSMPSSDVDSRRLSFGVEPPSPALTDDFPTLRPGPASQAAIAAAAAGTSESPERDSALLTIAPPHQQSNITKREVPSLETMVAADAGAALRSAPRSPVTMNYGTPDSLSPGPSRIASSTSIANALASPTSPLASAVTTSATEKDASWAPEVQEEARRKARSPLEQLIEQLGGRPVSMAGSVLSGVSHGGSASDDALTSPVTSPSSITLSPPSPSLHNRHMPSPPQLSPRSPPDTPGVSAVRVQPPLGAPARISSPALPGAFMLTPSPTASARTATGSPARDMDVSPALLPLPLSPTDREYMISSAGAPIPSSYEADGSRSRSSSPPLEHVVGGEPSAAAAHSTMPLHGGRSPSPGNETASMHAMEREIQRIEAESMGNQRHSAAFITTSYQPRHPRSAWSDPTDSVRSSIVTEPATEAEGDSETVHANAKEDLPTANGDRETATVTNPAQRALASSPAPRGASPATLRGPDITPRTAKRWSIIEMEEAFARMRNSACDGTCSTPPCFSSQLAIITVLASSRGSTFSVSVTEDDGRATPVFGGDSSFDSTSSRETARVSKLSFDVESLDPNLTTLLR